MQNVESSATRKSQGILVLSWLTGQVETRVQTELAGLYFPLEKKCFLSTFLYCYMLKEIIIRWCHKQLHVPFSYISDNWKNNNTNFHWSMKKQIVFILGWHKETPVNKATGEDQGIKK